MPDCATKACMACSWIPARAARSDDKKDRGGSNNENAQLSGLPVRRAAAGERAGSPEAAGHAGAAEDARGRRVPFRPAHLGRLLRDRRRQEADAGRPRHQAAAHHGARERRRGGRVRPGREGREGRRRAPGQSLDGLRRMQGVPARRREPLPQAAECRRVRAGRLCDAHAGAVAPRTCSTSATSSRKWPRRSPARASRRSAR